MLRSWHACDQARVDYSQAARAMAKGEVRRARERCKRQGGNMGGPGAVLRVNGFPDLPLGSCVGFLTCLRICSLEACFERL